jgi:hypothetical protein
MQDPSKACVNSNLSGMQCLAVEFLHGVTMLAASSHRDLLGSKSVGDHACVSIVFCLLPKGGSAALAKQGPYSDLNGRFAERALRDRRTASDLGRVKTSTDRKSPLTTCDFQACRFDVFDFSASKSKVSYLRKMCCAFSHGLDPKLSLANGCYRVAKMGHKC